MRLLLAVTLGLVAGAPAAATNQREPVASYHLVPRDVRSLADCPRPLLQHATRDSSTSVRPLAAMPSAYRLHAVDRRVAGCAVYPEAQKVSDDTGKLAVPRPRTR